MSGEARDLDAHLFDRALEIFSRTNPDEIVELILHSVVSVTGAEYGFVVLRNRSGRLDVVASAGVSKEAIGDVEEDRGHSAYAFSRTLVRQAIAEDRSVRVTNAATSDPAALTSSLRQLGVQSALVVPLRVDGRAVGAVYVDRRTSGETFDPRTQGVLEHFGTRIGAALRNANRLRELEAAQPAPRIAEIAGISPLLHRAVGVALRAAGTDATVLIEGETGTGKELVARGIHQNSPRAAKKFVAVNCAALPEHLLEGELFGWRKGAFSGAHADRAGKFAAADGGTIFLDEIAEMPATVQAKLLRVLQNGEIQRLGSDEPERVNVRIVAATHRNLEERAKAGSFRQDLFFRLRVVTVRLPALRERREDIPVLVEHFLGKFARRHGRLAMQMDPKALDALVARDYPGNVRELEHLIEAAVVLSPGPTVTLEDLEASGTGPVVAPLAVPRTWEDLRSAKDAASRELERLFVVEALRRSRGNVSQAAEETGADRTVLHQLLKKLGMNADTFR